MENYENTCLDNLQGEIWEPIKGYEGKYDISNFQRIKTLAKISANGHKLKEKIMRQTYDGEYLRLKIVKGDGFQGNPVGVHRIVANQCIPNPKNLKDVNHKNGIKIDNRPENLEWCTRSENLLHAYKNGKCSQNKMGDFDPRRKAVIQKDMSDNFIKEFSGMWEASRQTGIKQASISACSLGKLKHAGGFKWVRK